jgi:hypothetical protein
MLINKRELRRQHYLTMKRITLSEAIKAGPQELEPLQPNQRQLFFSREGYLDFLRNGLFAQMVIENDDVVVGMTLGEQFVVTVTAKAEAAGAQ